MRALKQRWPCMKQSVDYLLRLGSAVLLSLQAGCSTLGADPRPEITASQEVWTLRWGTPQRSADPLVDVTVGEAAAPFVIDTGTSEFLLTKRFAAHAGKLANPGLVRQPVSYAVGTRKFSAERFVVIDAPPLEAEGWGGLLSPQLLALEATVILDFPRMQLAILEARSASTLKLMDCGRAVDSYLSRYSVSAPVHRIEWRGRAYGAVLVAGGLRGRPDSLVDVDTGKSASAFHPAYMGPAIESGRPGPQFKNARGDIRQTTEVPDQAIRIGTLLVTNRSILAQEIGGSLPDGSTWQGNVGMDILKDAVIALCPKGQDIIYIVFR